MLENSPKLWANYYHDKRPDTHKYDYGHGVAVSGMEMTGATILASKAALRCGLGLLSISAPRELHSIYDGFDLEKQPEGKTFALIVSTTRN